MSQDLKGDLKFLLLIEGASRGNLLYKNKTATTSKEF